MTEDQPTRNENASERERLVRFETLLDRSEKLHARGLPFDELRELARLYRLHTARLAQLRDRAGDPDALRHLNALCVRGYGFLYSAGGRRPARTGDADEGRGWRAEIPAALLRTWRVQALAWALLALGAVLGAALALRDPSALYALLPAGFGYGPEQVDVLWSSASARSEFLAGSSSAAEQNAVFGSWLFAHNTRVGILAFTTGILLGIPTVLLQLSSGLMLGGFAAVFLRDPSALPFAAWLLPHAIPELTAVTLCAAAGLLLGAAVANPGHRTRARALREEASAALILFGCAVPLFLLAAVVESFVRQSMLSVGTRLAVAALEALSLVAVALALRGIARRQSDASWVVATQAARSAAPERP